MQTQYNAEILPLAMDVSNPDSVNRAIESLPNEWKNITILINNARLAISTSKIQDGNPEDGDKMIDTNIKGFLYVTKAILPNMLDQSQGHVM